MKTPTSLLVIALLVGSVLVAAPAQAAPLCFGKRATIVGTNEFAQQDRLVGTPRDDVIVGRRGIDIIYGRGGNDRICGGEGQDRIRGGPGRDRIHAGDQYCEERYDEILEGNEGRDLIIGSPCPDKIYGGKGSDTVRGNGSVLSLDRIFGGDGDDDIAYAPLDPSCECNEGAVFTPGPGVDEIDASGHRATLSYDGAARGVRVHLPAGRTTGEGTDIFNDILSAIGSAHDDVLIATDRGSILDAGAGADRVIGGAGTDTINGGPGRDTLSGEVGDDNLDGDAGDDQISGGDGLDTLSYFGLRSPVHVDLVLGRATGDGTDALNGLENVTGGRKNDTLLGDDGPNVLLDCCRSTSNDTMDGRGGDDVIRSDFGDDTLLGGAGNDDIFGDNGDDSLDGGDGIDELDGATGNDTCTNGEIVSNCEA